MEWSAMCCCEHLSRRWWLCTGSLWCSPHMHWRRMCELFFCGWTIHHWKTNLCPVKLVATDMAEASQPQELSLQIQHQVNALCPILLVWPIFTESHTKCAKPLRPSLKCPKMQLAACAPIGFAPFQRGSAFSMFIAQLHRGEGTCVVK